MRAEQAAAVAAAATARSRLEIQNSLATSSGGQPVPSVRRKLTNEFDLAA
jgi:hypothetical protein